MKPQSEEWKKFTYEIGQEVDILTNTYTQDWQKGTIVSCWKEILGTPGRKLPKGPADRGKMAEFYSAKIGTRRFQKLSLDRLRALSVGTGTENNDTEE